MKKDVSVLELETKECAKSDVGNNEGAPGSGKDEGEDGGVGSTWRRPTSKPACSYMQVARRKMKITT